jgi:hypothetical protein
VRPNPYMSNFKIYVLIPRNPIFMSNLVQKETHFTRKKVKVRRSSIFLQDLKRTNPKNLEPTLKFSHQQICTNKLEIWWNYFDFFWILVYSHKN